MRAPLPVRGKHNPYTVFGCNTYSIPTINLYSVIKRFRNTLQLVQFSKQDTLCVHIKNEPIDHVWLSLKTQGRNCNVRKFCAFGSCSWACSWISVLLNQSPVKFTSHFGDHVAPAIPGIAVHSCVVFF